MTRRLVLTYLSITVLVLVVFGVPLGLTYARRQVSDVTAQVERDAFAIASFAEDALEHGAPAPLLATTSERYQERTGGRVVIVDRAGMAIVDTDPTTPTGVSFASRPEIATALAGEVATGQRHSSTLGAGLVYVAVPVASGGTVHGAVRITYPTAAVDARVRRYWAFLGATGLVSLIAVALVGFGIARWVSRPVRELRQTASALGDGELDARAPTGQGPPELRTLSAAFNAMAERLEELVTAQDAFVADASHQLRTPLTALRLRLETLEPDVAPSSQDDLEAAMAEVARLSRIVDGLLALARPERMLAPQDLHDVVPLLQERQDIWEPLAAERGIALGVDAAAPLPARCRPDHLRQVLDNLLANALDAAPAGTSVRLAAGREGDAIAVHVLDQGPGLDPEARQRAFDRFWRATSVAPSGGLGGSGLGLAVVAKLVHADGGTVALEPAIPTGVDAVVRYRAAT
jgi:signal transduction histidine kinase